MLRILVGRHGFHAVGDDLRRARHSRPEGDRLRHLGATVSALAAEALAKAAMDDRRVVLAVDVEGRGVTDERKRLLWRLEGGIDTALGGGDADEPGFTIRRGERQEEMRVDRDLRPLLRQIVERGLPDDFAATRRRRQLEAQAGRRQIDLDDVHVNGARRRLGAIDVGDPGKRLRDQRDQNREQAQYVVEHRQQRGDPRIAPLWDWFCPTNHRSRSCHSRT